MAFAAGLVPRQIAMNAHRPVAIGVRALPSQHWWTDSRPRRAVGDPHVISSARLIALVMGYALAEMAVMHPVAGSFGVFADRYLSAWSGFAVRATYAFVQILAIGAEVTAVAIYFASGSRACRPWLWIVGLPRRSSSSTRHKWDCSASWSIGLR
jgi:hypothetical protein